MIGAHWSRGQGQTQVSPGDWDVAVGLLLANYAAMDQVDAKAATSVAKHYGSRDAMIEAGKKTHRATRNSGK
jgi:hypothetical protein